MTWDSDEELPKSRIADMPKELREQVELDCSVYGNAYVEKLEDGTWRRIPPGNIAVFALNSEPVSLGVPLITPKEKSDPE